MECISLLLCVSIYAWQYGKLKLYRAVIRVLIYVWQYGNIVCSKMCVFIASTCLLLCLEPEKHFSFMWADTHCLHKEAQLQQSAVTHKHSTHTSLTLTLTLTLTHYLYLYYFITTLHNSYLIDTFVNLFVLQRC